MCAIQLPGDTSAGTSCAAVLIVLQMHAPETLIAHCCNKIADAEAAVSVNEKKWFVMVMHVQLQLDELRGSRTLGSL